MIYLVYNFVNSSMQICLKYYPSKVPSAVILSPGLLLLGSRKEYINNISQGSGFTDPEGSILSMKVHGGIEFWYTFTLVVILFPVSIQFQG